MAKSLSSGEGEKNGHPNRELEDPEASLAGR